MRGFTLVEILVTVLILGFLVAAIYAVLTVGNIIFREDMSMVELQQQARRAMDVMVNEIRESRPAEITLTDGNTKITFNVAPQIYGDPWVGPISYFRDVNDNNADGIVDQVICEYPLGTRKILANDITTLNFSLLADIVTVEVAAKKSAAGRQFCFPAPCVEPPKALKEIVKLRN